jgi:hypothetical protein
LQIDKIAQNKKLCSSHFENDGDWYFQLYPNGYIPSGSNEKREKFISLFLHSTPNPARPAPRPAPTPRGRADGRLLPPAARARGGGGGGALRCA